MYSKVTQNIFLKILYLEPDSTETVELTASPTYWNLQGKIKKYTANEIF